MMKKRILFKSDITNTFLKTVSAFSIFRTGVIRFGYSDCRNICSLEGNIDSICLDIENKINDTILPKPNFKLECNYTNNTIDLIVYEGLYKPYLYKGKAYKRNDSSTIEIDVLELQRLILEGKNLSFEELDVNEELKFTSFNDKLNKILKINLNSDILKTFGLINDNGKYNNAALIISDNNSLRC